MNLTDAERRGTFDRAVSALAGKPDDGVYGALLAAYSEPHRVYHTQSHIDACLTLAATVDARLSSPGEVLLAIWFHDAIYALTPGAGNEEKSALLAESACGSMGISAESIARVAAMVRATEKHGAAGHEGDVDWTMLLDIDLSILGADPDTYARFERDIRAEYSIYPDELYRPGRAKVLATFLERPRIYASDYFRDRLEGPARRNLTEAIRSLTS